MWGRRKSTWIVAADAGRFTAGLGPGNPWGVLAELTLEEAR